MRSNGSSTKSTPSTGPRSARVSTCFTLEAFPRSLLDKHCQGESRELPPPTVCASETAYCCLQVRPDQAEESISHQRRLDGWRSAEPPWPPCPHNLYCEQSWERCLITGVVEAAREVLPTAMAATAILRPALRSCPTTAPSEADNTKPWSRRRLAGCSGLILHLLIRRYADLREEKSEHAEET